VLPWHPIPAAEGIIEAVKLDQKIADAIVIVAVKRVVFVMPKFH